MAKVSDDRKKQWRENREKLKAAGFSSSEASRISKSNANTQKALAGETIPEKNAAKAKAGKKSGEVRREKSSKPSKITTSHGPPEPAKKPRKSRKAAQLQATDPGTAQFNTTINRWYKEVSHTQKYYYNAFTYVVEFRRKDGTLDYITITSDIMLSAWEVERQARQILVEAYFLPTAENTPPKKRTKGSDPTKMKPLLSTIRIAERIYNRAEHVAVMMEG